MSINYTGLAATAQKLIKNAGRAVQFYTPASGEVYDPISGTTSPGTPAVYIDGFGVKLSYKHFEFNELVQAGDAKLIYSGTKPSIGQYIDLDGETWRAQDVKPLEPAGTNLMYTVQLRR